MSSTVNMTAVHTAYDAFATGELERFVELLDPGFVSRQSDAVPWRGDYHGRDGVREMFGRVARSGNATFRPDEFIDGGDRIVVVGHAHLIPHRTGQGVDIRELHIWHVHNGRLMSLDVFLNAPGPLLASLAA
ncbi:hypothetical protein B0T36_17055 [Nocardia donostiensis]|uniref:nuclear transport factor 2 family protein n=1 Tax=Nocardia donostiensis TaxID=1538463 RepID=UPI0009DB64D6|nr:nuclear transport factor 2 family protein [Nocardia donostiensis]OQS13847.1 hypothetical protein B0T36_17055 [Nocardia donostiensis]